MGVEDILSGGIKTLNKGDVIRAILANHLPVSSLKWVLILCCCASKKILSLVSLVGGKAPGHMYYCTGMYSLSIKKQNDVRFNVNGRCRCLLSVLSLSV